MKKSQIITILAALLIITGLVIQVFYDDRGFYLVILAFILSISNQITRANRRKKSRNKDKYN